MAGIAFLAFTWDLLGPFGQITVLLLLGAAALGATDRLLIRLHGTAMALGVVGTLLVTIAAIGARTLGPDVIGAGASLLVAIAIMTTLCATAIWLRPRTASIGELAGVAGSVGVLVLLATAPVDEALPLPEPWSWWVALSCGGGSVALLVLADRVRLSSWPWVGAVFLVISAISLAVFVQATTEDFAASEAEPAVAALTLLIAAVGVAVLLRRLQHVWPVTLAALAMWSLALFLSWTSGVSTPEARPWAALVLAMAGAVALAPALLVVGHSWLRSTIPLVGSLAVGAAVGLAVAPWLDPLLKYLNAESWAGQAWPPWRGLLAGLVFVALLIASAAFAPRVFSATTDADGGTTETVSPLLGFAELLPPAAGLVTWLIASLNDLGEATAGRGTYLDTYRPQPTPDAFQHQLAIAMTVLALGLLAMVLLRRLPALSVWAVPVLAIPAALFELSTRSLDSTTEPEVYGLALGIPTLVASIGWWWLRRPERTPTWQTIAPPFVLVVAPSTLALLDETTNRWFLGDNSSTAYQVRMVTLLTIGVVAAIVGAWQRWGGLFFPGLGLTLIVVGIELIDLGRFLPQWLSFAVAGAVLIAAGARWEWVRQRGKAGATWVRSLT